GMTSLHYATKQGCLNSVKELLELNAQVDSRNNNQETPLMFAAMLDKVEIADMLVLAGADTNATDIHENTIMDIAQSKGSQQFVDWLIEFSKKSQKIPVSRYLQMLKAKSERDELKKQWAKTNNGLEDI
ncbi:unnamed protein product, partial [Meganyctiphanes norvegica]